MPIDPEEPLTPTRRPAKSVTSQEFEELVGDGLDLVPPELMNLVDNLVFLVEEEPRPDQGGRGLLGIYEGTPLTERGGWWDAGSLPDVITIFRGPILRYCTYADQVAKEVAVTVIHEIAHHFGIEDDQLQQWGWG